MARKSNQKRKTTDRDALSERSRWARLLAWMLERIKAGLWHVAHFLWEWSWTFSIPVGVILAMTLGSYSPDDPAFSVSTSKSPENLCGLWGAWAADLLFGAFGLSAWWIVPGFFMIAVFAIRSQLRRARGENGISLPPEGFPHSFHTPPRTGFGTRRQFGRIALRAFRPPAAPFRDRHRSRGACGFA